MTSSSFTSRGVTYTVDNLPAVASIVPADGWWGLFAGLEGREEPHAERVAVWALTTNLASSIGDNVIGLLISDTLGDPWNPYVVATFIGYAYLGDNPTQETIDKAITARRDALNDLDRRIREDA